MHFVQPSTHPPQKSQCDERKKREKMREDARLKVQTGIAKGKTGILIDSQIKKEIKLQSTFEEQLWQFEYTQYVR